VQGLEARSNHLQHRTCSGQHRKQRRLVVSVLGWFHGSYFWRVLRRGWPASVLRLRKILQRGFVHLQTSLHHRLQRQGDRTTRCGPATTTKPTATHAAWYGLLVPAAVAAPRYSGNRITATPSSFATHTARNNHRIASSVATAKRGVLDVSAATAVAASTARNSVRVAPAFATSGCGVPAIASAAAHAARSCFAATRTAAWRGLRHVSASTANHHAVSRLPVPDCGMLDDLVQRDRGYRGRWRVSLQHRRQRRMQGLETGSHNLQHGADTGQHGQ
jgi:hypothetical protein